MPQKFLGKQTKEPLTLLITGCGFSRQNAYLKFNLSLWVQFLTLLIPGKERQQKKERWGKKNSKRIWLGLSSSSES